MKKSWIISAIILRLCFSIFFFHPDIKSQNFHAQFFSSGTVNIYSYISSNLTHLPYRDTFNYPPLTYYLLGSWNYLAKLILGQPFIHWLNDWGPDGYLNSQTMEFMLVLKFPYLIFDLSVGFLIYKLLPEKNRKIGLMFWLFNPISLYAIYMLGQFDIICAFLTVAALYLTQKNRLFSAVFLLGLGTALKTYPILLLPFVLMRSRNIKIFISQIFIFFLTVFTPTLPVLFSDSFRYTISHSNLMQSIFTAGIAITDSQKIPFYVLIYTFTLYYSWQHRSKFNLLPEFFITTFAVILLSDFHAQWIVWSLPFITMLWVNNYQKKWLLFLAVFLGYFFTNFLIYDQYSFLGLFSPLNSRALLFPMFPELIKPLIDPLILQSLFRSLLLGSGLWLIYLVYIDYDQQ